MRRLSFPATLAIAIPAALAAPIPPPRPELQKPGWVRIDPGKSCQFSTNSDGLTIEVPATDHDFDSDRQRFNAPRVVRHVEGDFRVEVRVKGRFHASTQASAAKAQPGSTAGLFVHFGSKEKSSLRLVFGALRWRGEERRCVATRRVSESGAGTIGYLRVDSPKGWPLKPGEALLRLDRTGGRFFAYFSADGKRWSPLGGHVESRAPNKVQVGIIACNTSRGRLEVEFTQFKLHRPAAPADKGKK